MIPSAALLCLGLFSLAAGMRRHAPMLLGTWSTHKFAERAPLAGWTLTGLSLLCALLAPRWGLALVQWFGLAPLMAGIIALSLTFAPMLARAAACVAVAGLLLGLFSAAI